MYMSKEVARALRMTWLKRIGRIAGIGAVVLGLGGACGGMCLYINDSDNQRQRREHAAREASNTPIKATVLEENYACKVPQVVLGDDAEGIAEEDLSFDCTYTLKLRTDTGRMLGLEVLDGDDHPNELYAQQHLTVTKESLDALLEPGSRVEFPAGNITRENGCNQQMNIAGETYFTDDTSAGAKYADRIKVL